MRFLNKHSEWIVFSIGLLLLGTMNPENSGISLCFFDFIGIEFCPGEGLGRSISYTMKGDFSSALNAHLAGPAAVGILLSRIIHVCRNLYQQSKITK
jgi:hypothetical protein